MSQKCSLLLTVPQAADGGRPSTQQGRGVVSISFYVNLITFLCPAGGLMLRPGKLFRRNNVGSLCDHRHP